MRTTDALVDAGLNEMESFSRTEFFNYLFFTPVCAISGKSFPQRVRSLRAASSAPESLKLEFRQLIRVFLGLFSLSLSRIYPLCFSRGRKAAPHESHFRSWQRVTARPASDG